MKPDEILLFYGTKYKFQQNTGISSPTLANWIKWGYVPFPQQCRLEMFTDGQLKASKDDLPAKKLQKIKFTHEQLMFICYQIDEWYLKWKDSICEPSIRRYVEDTPWYRLSLAKEELKIMICSEGVNKDE